MVNAQFRRSQPPALLAERKARSAKRSIPAEPLPHLSGGGYFEPRVSAPEARLALILALILGLMIVPLVRRIRRAAPSGAIFSWRCRSAALRRGHDRIGHVTGVTLTGSSRSASLHCSGGGRDDGVIIVA